jgi:hypothetical protein
MSENTTIWAKKNPKVQPNNTSIKGPPPVGFFRKSANRNRPPISPNRKSPTDFLRVTCCHAARRDDELYVMMIVTIKHVLFFF